VFNNYSEITSSLGQILQRFIKIPNTFDLLIKLALLTVSVIAMMKPQRKHHIKDV